MKRKYTGIYIIITAMSFLLQGCLFEYIIQPSSAKPGDVIDIEVAVKTKTVPENNAHKGVLGIIAPADWELVSASYTSDLGNGILTENADWKDSVDNYYPTEQYGSNMKWFVLVSDKGYSYTTSVTFTAHIKMKVGASEGCFNLGYLATKATSGLLGTSWTPLSYPHSIGIPDSNLCETPYKVRKAPEWDTLFNRTSGWTGADGIYSIPLNEIDKTGSGSGKQLIIFSDTFIGEVNSSNARVNSKIVNNTYALINTPQPEADNLTFYWGGSGNTPDAVFKPETPSAQPGDWYWLMDGISIHDTVYVYALRMHSTGSGAFNFAINGVILLKFNLDEQNKITNLLQYDTPLFYKNEQEGWEIAFGQAIMPMSESSANPGADGYIYIYGPKDNGSDKKLAAARVLPEFIEDFNKYEYWTGSVWGGSISDCAAIASGISQEFSVTPTDTNKFLLIAQSGNSVIVKTGDTPAGPFGISHLLYNCPEVIDNPNIFVYNAKAHPSLSASGELLISYNVNSLSLSELMNDAGIYRPRFIALKISNSTGISDKDNNNGIKGYRLEQNYPNPFNPSTSIQFTIAEPGIVSLKIYDILGREIAVLINNYMQSGTHSITFDASSLPSGVYCYRIEAGDYSAGRKMILLK
jgi:hypothetical protein